MAYLKDRTGETRINNQGLTMRICAYSGTNHMDVIFDDGYIAKNVTYQNFKKGNILNHNIKQRRKAEYEIGEVVKNYQGCDAQLIKFNNTNDVIVKFLDKHSCEVKTRFWTFKEGKVRNPYSPSVCGVGIIGNKHKIPSKEYYAWADMIKRSCNPKTKQKHQTYKNVTCCDEWLYYENFYDWIHKQDNFDKWLNGEHWCIDKDIIKKDNLIYCPEYCCLVSNRVNCLFVRNKSFRGQYPIGVIYHKATQKYQSSCKNEDGVDIHLGLFDNSTDAFKAYKKAKENLIKIVACKEYAQHNITQKCYEAMMKYEVEIDD